MAPATHFIHAHKPRRRPLARRHLSSRSTTRRLFSLPTARSRHARSACFPPATRHEAVHRTRIRSTPRPCCTHCRHVRNALSLSRGPRVIEATCKQCSPLPMQWA